MIQLCELYKLKKLNDWIEVNLPESNHEDCKRYKCEAIDCHDDTGLKSTIFKLERKL